MPGVPPFDRPATYDGLLMLPDTLVAELADGELHASSTPAPRHAVAYAREGLPWAWLIDPLARTLEVLKLEGGRWTILATHADNEAVRAEPFEAIELELAALWGNAGDGPLSSV